MEGNLPNPIEKQQNHQLFQLHTQEMMTKKECAQSSIIGIEEHIFLIASISFGNPNR